MAENKQVAIVEQKSNLPTLQMQFTEEEIALFVKKYCAGAPETEVKLFIRECQRTGLDPSARQIYLIKRTAKTNKGGQWVSEDTFTTQVGIDGFRIIAERTGQYAGCSEPDFKYDADNRLKSCTMRLYRMVGGQAREWSATVFFDEYAQTYKKDGQEHLTAMWLRMPHSQLAKCCEAVLLRKAFPNDLSGLYTSDEYPEPKAIEAEAEVIPADVNPDTGEVKELPDIKYASDTQIDRLIEYLNNDFLYEKTNGKIAKLFEDYPDKSLIPAGRAGAILGECKKYLADKVGMAFIKDDMLAPIIEKVLALESEFFDLSTDIGIERRNVARTMYCKNVQLDQCDGITLQEYIDRMAKQIKKVKEGVAK